MRVKYIPVFVTDIEEGINFFKEKLGCNLLDKMVLNSTEYQLIETNGLCLALTVDEQGTGLKTRVIINSDDCLKDYHNLKIAGVCFNNSPQYLPVGLAANFNDDYGNEYVLLEERNYNDL
jgi:predicted enzyme related to lactoylglutathione lyase